MDKKKEILKQITNQLDSVQKSKSYTIRNVPVKITKKWKRTYDWLGYSKVDEFELFSLIINFLDEIIYLADKKNVSLDKNNIKLLLDYYINETNEIFNKKIQPESEKATIEQEKIDEI